MRIRTFAVLGIAAAATAVLVFDVLVVKTTRDEAAAAPVAAVGPRARTASDLVRAVQQVKPRPPLVPAAVLDEVAVDDGADPDESDPDDITDQELAAAILADAMAATVAGTGTLYGELLDNAERRSGLKVVARATDGSAQQTVWTEEGYYQFTKLPPATYRVTFDVGHTSFERVIEVRADTVTRAHQTFVHGYAIIDDYTVAMPVGRTFAGVLGSASSSQGDFIDELEVISNADGLGITFSGGTSLENVYIIE